MVRHCKKSSPFTDRSVLIGLKLPTYSCLFFYNKHVGSLICGRHIPVWTRVYGIIPEWPNNCTAWSRERNAADIHTHTHESSGNLDCHTMLLCLE